MFAILSSFVLLSAPVLPVRVENGASDPVPVTIRPGQTVNVGNTVPVTGAVQVTNVVPINGAVAVDNPVQVGNDAAHPVPVVLVDPSQLLKRLVFQGSLSFAGTQEGLGQALAQLFQVPEGKQFVIDAINLVMFFGAESQGASAFFTIDQGSENSWSAGIGCSHTGAQTTCTGVPTVPLAGPALVSIGVQALKVASAAGNYTVIGHFELVPAQ
ncbi:MAG TPA: hypothetical protein VLW85_22595 [Myxococcales bacterium]|nr:hypothetical protein [Myxococcales bacterium]